MTLVTAAGCAREGVYGYCGQGDTCRYDLPEKMLVRTYNGFIEPGSTSFASESYTTEEASAGIAPVAIETVEETGSGPAAPTPASIGAATVSAPAATMVAISN